MIVMSDDRSQNGTEPKIPIGRVLGLDVGSRRIGVAVSDPLGITAQGLQTLQRRNKRYDFEQLQHVIQEYDVREIVVGLPLRMSGNTVGPDASFRRRLAQALSIAGAFVG
jgi:putative Holliday junction resolvase